MYLLLMYDQSNELTPRLVHALLLACRHTGRPHGRNCSHTDRNCESAIADAVHPSRASSIRTKFGFKSSTSLANRVWEADLCYYWNIGLLEKRHCNYVTANVVWSNVWKLRYHDAVLKAQCLTSRW